ncbi:DJ-1 protein-PfpI domain-containing protein [Favolaschia claudopus]|uniref:DJ-1 protein-PfpI domain-containing protein n=1 Tax=Favolaschia claudopus TaxID=2862362 RepID=A0AAW0DSK6_9AGAR
MKNHSPLLSSAASTSSFQVRHFLCRMVFFVFVFIERNFARVSIPCRRPPVPRLQASPTRDDHRWSEVVPPEAGLTFAVVWDPEEKDLLTFSRPSCRNVVLIFSPPIPPPTPSTIHLLPPSLPGTMQFFQQNHDFCSRDPNSIPVALGGSHPDSSTLDGLDVVGWGLCLRTPIPRSLTPHMWAKGMETKEMPRDDVSDEGFFEGHQFAGMDNEFNLPSRFSGTTTSTEFDEASADWSTLEAPDTPGYHRRLFTPPPPSTPPHRVLRKTRPHGRPASPSHVLERRDYNHSPCPSASAPPSPDPPRSRTPSSISPRLRTLSRVRSLPKIARNITGRWKKTSDGAGWVWIDVKERSTSA